jgi:hypothetical protein
MRSLRCSNRERQSTKMDGIAQRDLMGTFLALPVHRLAGVHGHGSL